MNNLLAVILSVAAVVFAPSGALAQDQGRQSDAPRARSDAFDDGVWERGAQGLGSCPLRRPRDFDLLLHPPTHLVAELRESIETL